MKPRTETDVGLPPNPVEVDLPTCRYVYFTDKLGYWRYETECNSMLDELTFDEQFKYCPFCSKTILKEK